MAKVTLSSKRFQIDKANAQLAVIIAVSAFVTIFSVVSCKALLNKRAYQSRVIQKKELAAKQLTENLKARDKLVTTYQEFVASGVNLIGGTSGGSGLQDGDNARLILDALPSKYDFPALATSLEKILTERNYQIDSLVGIDDEIAQQKTDATTLQPIVMPFSIGVSGTYARINDLLSVFEDSIRPFHINKLQFSGTNSDLKLTLDAKTYYQPEKTLSIKKEVIK